MSIVRYSLFAALAALIFVAAANADPITLATFADPGTTCVQFTSTGTDAGYIEAWNDNVTLEILTPGAVYHGASFVMTDADGGVLDLEEIHLNHRGALSQAVFEGGVLEFYDENDVLIVGFGFDELYLTPLSLQTFANAENDIFMYGPASTVLDGGESFGFAFGDLDYYGDAGDFVATASFTSSGITSPEPMTMILMGAGAALTAYIARRKYHCLHAV